MPYTLQLPCERAGFGAAFASSRISVQLDGGKPRERADVFNAWDTADVTWICTPQEYNYLMAFVRVHERSGEPFTVDVITAGDAAEAHTALFVPNSVRLTAQSGDAFTVSAQIRCTPVDVRTSAEDIATVVAGP
jgi:hypothetical protein